MPLPTGTWKLNMGGRLGSLLIKSVDIQGNVSGTVTYANLGAGYSIIGHWSEAAKKLVFHTAGDARSE